MKKTSRRYAVHLAADFPSEFSGGFLFVHQGRPILPLNCLAPTHLNQLIKVFQSARDFQAGVLQPVGAELCRILVTPAVCDVIEQLKWCPAEGTVALLSSDTLSLQGWG